MHKKRFAKRRLGRAVDGILLLNKPTGITSAQALAQVKDLYQARKAGHTGSLDPLASGMLPVCFGQATKFCQFLLEADKYYDVTAILGQRTETGDAEGEVIERCEPPHYTQAQLDAVLAKFRGDIEQVPSMYSALKYQGQPLYKLARQGIEVPRQARRITVFSLEQLDYQRYTLTLRVHCSKGTYIRTLVEDMGAALGCGAYVGTLHRFSVGPYQHEMHELKALHDLATKPDGQAALLAKLLPLDSMVSHWPALYLDKALSHFVLQGQVVRAPQAATKPGWVRLYNQDKCFLGVGEVLVDGNLAPRRLLQPTRQGGQVTNAAVNG